MGEDESEISLDSVRDRIHKIRGMSVMLDSDLAKLYGVKTFNLNKAVKRNIQRFPEDFCFQLNLEEFESLIFHFGISKKGRGGRRYLPYVFTEHGVAMLSGVLKSRRAIEVNVKVIRAFVAMRKFLVQNAGIFQRVEKIEQKLVGYGDKFGKIFRLIEDKSIKPSKGIFFDGQVFDAYKFVADVVRSARKSIILIDNYVDDTVLTLFSKRRKGVDVVIYSKNVSKKLKLDVEKYNSQYEKVIVKEFSASHDRFMIIDGGCVYHIGASLKDLGKKWFAFSKFDVENFGLMERLES